MESVTPNKPALGAYYMFEPDVESNRSACGVQFTNKRQLLSSPRLILRPDEGGFPPLRELPLLTLEPSAGPEPRDLEAGFSGYWLISARLHDVRASVDPEAFAFAEVDYRMADGTPGARHYLCDVVRERDALDEAGSRLKIKIDDDYVRGKVYSLAGGASLAFRSEALKGAHVFRTPFNPTAFCDQVFKAAVLASGIPDSAEASGISLVDASDI
ncbi:DUF1629 domain-containing protein [Xanthomonas euvesicatoria pv. euvesicatoria]|uniref:Immunity MXAN-0049 protein domain-containing protein n=3 Tax=Xanthomonas euvesicatoria TaxID=456327 RepID=Q3BPZ4_XANE5|nr:DUF1629 domain-containing protein [Xanthomonas euvesicatoria]AOY66821.1 hypothetical protein BHE83_09785 [Xanthomonas euvesicatoria pv. vesicatoria str. 85-10]APO89593.1 hypothetical protein BJD11_05550 [Xanthomonas euvesicatoria]KHL53348.1 hypothetical protein XEU66b_21950 [Xanthomonas euvesicatoria]KHL65704.1 hypothetical protein XEU83M_10480 [Xanthomonas euvesicatoria]KLA49637.1 hypothetical protein XEUV683_21615 [Xanthomonas euvesicatoria]